ncbi:hypothetical protein 8014-B2_0068 [Lactobacillus phage ATCC 8014-B2]|uniref:Uncharacterized protein n=1 Tax=Lactobacillus phage ATCC 8014-B2 TaxID=1225795 RepID=K4I4E2_9CAUD|nr:hypothetical protein HOQ89_gp078 [Lactobacillus phage ATCC 8014-B2]AFU63135.1 hypothetical protein 8014-B2_0068 [Lactobacillus phage ATCC 8014-B2]
MGNEEEYIRELEEQVEDLEAENDSLGTELDNSEIDNQELSREYDSLEQDYDDLYKENVKLRERLENSNVPEIINDIHSMIGNGITSGEFKKIADMLSIKYYIKEPIFGLDYGE